MPIQLIVASSEPRFHDFVREQLASTPNAEVTGEHEDLGPNLSARILHDLNLNPQSAILLDISPDPEQGLRALEQMKLAIPGLYVILSGFESSEELLLRSMRLGGADFLQQPLKRAEFSDAMIRLEEHAQRIHRQGRQIGRMYTFVGVKAVTWGCVISTRSPTWPRISINWIRRCWTASWRAIRWGFRYCARPRKWKSPG